LRRKLIAGNWKMNLLKSEASELVEKLKSGLAGCERVDIVVCPNFLLIERVAGHLQSSNISVGAQDVFYEQQGAFTGEVSPPMLKDIGCTHVIVGHSERRSIFGETEAHANRKLKKSLEWGLVPILCVGETLGERKEMATFEVITRQVTYALEGLNDDAVARVVIAYEPVWAIGTGVSATAEQAEEVHGYIRGIIGKFSGPSGGNAVRIIYGGSVTAENASGLLSRKNIDGALVGGASLKAESFARIVHEAESVSAGLN